MTVMGCMSRAAPADIRLPTDTTSRASPISSAAPGTGPSDIEVATTSAAVAAPSPPRWRPEPAQGHSTLTEPVLPARPARSRVDSRLHGESPDSSAPAACAFARAPEAPCPMSGRFLRVLFTSLSSPNRPSREPKSRCYRTTQSASLSLNLYGAYRKVLGQEDTPHLLQLPRPAGNTGTIEASVWSSAGAHITRQSRGPPPGARSPPPIRFPGDRDAPGNACNGQ